MPVRRTLAALLIAVVGASLLSPSSPRRSPQAKPGRLRFRATDGQAGRKQAGALLTLFLVLVALLPPLPVFAAQVTTDSLVGYWKFDETAFNGCSGGQDSCDSSGDGNHGTESGTPTISTDVPTTSFTNARSLSFDGTNDYVAASDSNSLDITDAVTVTAWIKPSDSGNSIYRTILAKRPNAGAANYELYLKNDAAVIRDD